VEPLPGAEGDLMMMKLVWQNLIQNAVKYTRTREEAIVEIKGMDLEKETVYSIRDNGVGFDQAYSDKLFGVFQRLHRMEDYEGTGIGLANVRRIIARHSGRTWAEGEVDRGACFYFSLPRRVRDHAEHA
jgi:light-regulated signal transduction histidine kinase (bacteriophytochrome)